MDQKELIELYRKYYQEVGKVWPDRDSAVLFAVTEVAEALDAILREDSKWNRNHDRNSDLNKEICQAIMMLMIGLEENGADFPAQTLKFMAEKGFVPMALCSSRSPLSPES